MKPWLILAVFVAMLLSASVGYVKGGVDNEAAHTQQLADAQAKALSDARAATAAETKRLIADAVRAAEARDLEDKAYAEPVTNPASLPASRVRRLNSR